LGVRCLAGGLPEFASISFRRIVLTPELREMRNQTMLFVFGL
jgi:hypothetical protein